MILGITGGLGCGKSTAAHFFEGRGYLRLDSDEMVRNQVLTDPAVKAAIREHFGPEAMLPDGSVNRVAVAERVFSDDTELTWLEQLTHPEVFKLWRKAVTQPLPVGCPGWAVEVPLLFEKSLEKWFDFTVCVACTPQLQLVRLERRGLNSALAGQRISKQLPIERKIELSDFVLWNDGSADFLKTQVDRLADSLKDNKARTTTGKDFR